MTAFSKEFLSFYTSLDKSEACTTEINFRAIAPKLPSLEGVKYFNKTGNRKILARTICPKIGGNSRSAAADVPAKFEENRIWKFQSIAIFF